MTPRISVTADERKTLLDHLRRAPRPELRTRAHILLLLADGHAWATIAAALSCSTRTIARWKGRLERGRTEALLGRTRGAPARLADRWAPLVVGRVTGSSPRAFGSLRSRWPCAVLALVLGRQYRAEVSREAVRRWLHRAELVWRRPRPVLGRRDPDREAVLRGLRALLRHLPADEAVVFGDEVDVDLNPKIGCMGMPRGRQAGVVTPGDNDKRYLAGSLSWRTGELITTEGPQRDAELFVRHLHELRRRLRRYRRIHVICDRAEFHYDCWAVWRFVARYGGRVVLHFLPRYAPECDPIERIWWALHERVTRNHRCRSPEELVGLVMAWSGDRKSFTVEDSVYRQDQPA